jgi:hypothetical protein
MLDTDVILQLHRMALWERFKSAFKVVVPSIIAREARFYLDQFGERYEIDLLKQAADGEIEEVSASVEELAALQTIFNADLLEGLHVGEQEAVALIISGSFSEGSFCSADKLALEALSSIRQEGRLISLERAVVYAGISTPTLSRQWTQKHLEEAIARGRKRRSTGQGLVRSIWDSI